MRVSSSYSSKGYAAFVFALLAPLAAQAAVVLSEIQYDPVGGGTYEFVELHNSGLETADLGRWFFSDGITYQFDAGTALAPGGYLVLAVDRAAFAERYPAVTNLATRTYAGQLSNGGERLALSDASSNVVFDVTYNNKQPWPEAAAGLGSSLVLVDPLASPADPANWVASAELNGSPGGPGGFFVSDIVINEVLAHTDPPQEDAVELRNLTTNAVNMAGWFLSDDDVVRKKYRFPTNTVIGPLDYLVVYQYQMMDTNDSLVPFSVSSKGDDLYLSEADGSGEIVRYVDQVEFDATRNGVAVGRWPDATGDLERLAVPTFGVSSPTTLEEFRTGTGARNAGPWVGPVAINEIMYHPPDSNTSGRAETEYVELLNTSGTPVPLCNTEHPELTWRLRGGLSFDFPTNVVLTPGEYLVVVGTNDVEGFRQEWSLPPTLRVFGPFSNALDNAGDSVNLRAPNNPEPATNVAAYHLQDRVKYNDRLPWPLAADGLGGSLERIDPTAYGNTAENWHSAPNVATPGAVNSDYVTPGAIVISEVMAVNRHTLQDEDGEYPDWIELYNTRSYDIPLGGWYLTDQSAMPTQWTFPPVTIPAHGYLVVFASQKHRTNDVAHLHTSFALDESGEYLALFRPDLVREFAFDPAFPPQFADIGYGTGQFGSRQEVPVQEGSLGRYLVPTNAAALASNWVTTAFDDSGWNPAVIGLGYEAGSGGYETLISTDLRVQMFDVTPSAFVRFPFVVSNSAEVAKIDLRMKFDDGFIAWLNGVRVASNNVPANAGWDADADSSRSDSQAVVFENYDLSDQAFRLADGTNTLAFQLLNNGSDSSDLLLLPELQLNWSGGSTGSSGYAQGYLQTASPGSQNDAIMPGVAPTPTLSHPGGVFAGMLSVTVTCARVDAEIRYTLDGGVPTTNSTLYTTPLEFSGDAELIVRAFLPGLVPSPTVGAVYRKSFLGINEFLASNASATPEIADFTDFGDWIELYNAGTTSVAVGGYHLSDNLEQPFRWPIPAGAVVPAGGHLLVWADGYDSYPGLNLNRPYWPYSSFTTRDYHASFKLLADGEAVGLFSPSGSRVDAIAYGPQSTDISCGRYPDGAANWRYFGEPTAEAANLPPALTHNLNRAPAVTIAGSNDALIVTGTVHVVMFSEPGVTEIRYTTDSSTPTSASTLYTQSFDVVSGGIIRARAYAPDRHPGPVATRTFLHNVRTPELPIISLVIDPYLLDDSVRGIYRRELKQRDVPGNFQFWTSPNQAAFQIDAGFRLYSLNTFTKAQKPFTVDLKGNYGYPELAYQLFPDKPIGLFDRFILRNGNDDWEDAFLRDTLGQKMLTDVIDNGVQAFVPCAMYLNGNYYGLINIQEKMDEMFCVKNYGVPLEYIDFFENEGTGGDDWTVNAGTEDGWLALLAYLAANDMDDPGHYAYVKSQVDLEDIADYVAGQTFVMDSGWFHNRKWWRDRRPGGRWRWCFVDLDRALDPGRVSYDQFSRMARSGDGMRVFKDLIDNDEFRAYCAQRVMAHFNSSFSPDRIIPIIDEEAQRIRSEIVEHVQLYDSQYGIPSVAAWEAEIEGIRSYARQRPAIAMQQVADYFGGRTAHVQIDVDGGSGRVLANYVELRQGATNIFVEGMPMQLTALPDIGQTFVRWEAVSNATATLVAAGSVWRYLDTVTNEIPGWADPGYDDSSWLSGPGQLGYGDGDEATTISYGTNSANKRVTFYVRRVVNLPDPGVYAGIRLELLRDDGAVMYVNGKEVLRDNIPAGPVTIDTTSITNLTRALGENDYNVFMLSPTNFTAGTNTLAFEIHQFANNNADTGFDLRMTGIGLPAPMALTNGVEMTWTPESDGAIRAVFAPSGVSLLPTVIASNTALTAAGAPYYATGDIFVPSNTTLSAEGGVDILMPETADIRVQGQLQLRGTPHDPVRVLPNTNANAAVRYRVNPSFSDAENAARRWGGISFEHATHTGELVNVVVRDASLTKTDPVNFKAAISALGSDLFMDGLDIDDVWFPIFVQEGQSTVLQNSKLRIARTGDGINLKRTEYARIEGCDISGGSSIDTDAIDYDGILGGIIRGNYLHDFMGDNNDAIDIGEGAQSLIVESNLIARCYDKGVSIGQASTTMVRHNVIRNCDIGIGIKDAGSFGLIEHNTFHNTAEAVAVYEKNFGAGGGSATIRNCIFSGNHRVPVTVDTLSTARVSYCLSDTQPVAGVGNRAGEPRFERPKRDNFRLQTGSPAVDSGDPAAPNDPDGTRTDMGARTFDWREGHAVITEIHYHPALSNMSEFVELYNVGGSPVNLGGWQFSKGVDLVFPAGLVLQPRRHLVVAADTNGVSTFSDVMAWTTGVLDNAGETIQLLDAVSNEIDQVTYVPGFPWPHKPDGEGPSLVLISPRLDNALPGSWHASTEQGGNPGVTLDNLTPGPISMAFAGASTFRVVLGGVPGILYRLEHAGKLGDAWTPTGNDQSVVNGLVILEHETNASKGFYRIRVVIP